MRKKNIFIKPILTIVILFFSSISMVFPIQNQKGFSTVTSNAFDKFFVYNGSINLSQEKTIIGNIREVIIDDEHNIWVLDSKKCEIKKFNPDGKLVKILGNKGAGPGEFARPISFDIFKQHLFVSDPFLGRLHVFNLTDEKFKYSIAISDGRTIKVIESIDNDKSDCIILTAPLTYSSEKKLYCIHFLDIKGKWKYSFFPINDNAEKNNLICDGTYFVIDKVKNVYAVQEMDYKIFKFNIKGQRLKIFSKQNNYYTPPPGSPFKQTFLKSKLDSWVRSWTHIVGLKIYGNQLFVILENITDKSSRYIIDVYNLNGDFIEGELESDFRLLYVDKHGTFYFLKEMEDETGSEISFCIEKYSIRDLSESSLVKKIRGKK